MSVKRPTETSAMCLNQQKQLLTSHCNLTIFRTYMLGMTRPRLFHLSSLEKLGMAQGNRERGENVEF